MAIQNTQTDVTGRQREIPEALAKALRAWLGDDGVEFFALCLADHGTVSPVLPGRIPHPVHWREGMSVRNFMRRSGFCEGWTDHELDEAWSRAVEAALGLD
jgi:hypothetical protein